MLQQLFLQPQNSNCDSTLVQTYVSAIFAAPKAFVSWTDAGLLAVLGIEAHLPQLLFVEACKRAHASLIAPPEYSSVVLSSTLGTALLRDIPLFHVRLGTPLFVIAGIAVELGKQSRNRKLKHQLA